MLKNVTKEMGKERELGVVDVHRKWRFSPAAIAVLRARLRAAWGLSGCGIWGKRERGTWGLCRSKRGRKRWSKSCEFKSAINSAVLGNGGVRAAMAAKIRET